MFQCLLAGFRRSRQMGQWQRTARTLLWLSVASPAALSTAAMGSNMSGEFSAGMATPVPTGITIKYWNSPTTAYDAFAEWSFNDHKYNLHADYLVHDFNQVYMDDADVPVYYGMGIRMIEEKGEDFIAGIRIPIGISYLQRDKPFDLFAEVAPRLNLTPSTNFGMDAQVGIRFRF